jgi:hypothetical protein
MPPSLVPHKRFEGLIYIIFRVLKMQAADSFETMVTRHQSKRRYITEYGILQTYKPIFLQ